MPEGHTARAPGKLFIAGEYAVVEPSNAAILVAVDRLLSVRATPTSAGAVTITSDAYHAPRHWTPAEGAGDYLTAAITVMEDVREARGLPQANYDLDITSDLARGGRKLGLGSSGALTVATIAALAGLYRIDLTLTERYRLAMCATIQISPRASGGDVAASTFGGWIRYTSPDRDRVAASLTRFGAARTVADDAVWEGATISWVPAPDLPLLVGWTAAPAQTDSLVAAAESSKGYPEFYADSGAVVDDFLASTRAGDRAALLAVVTRGRQVLRRFAAARGVLIETPALTALCDAAEAHGGAGKTSGAGGGDCGIAFAPAAARHDILEQWESSGIIPLDLAPHPQEGDEP